MWASDIDWCRYVTCLAFLFLLNGFLLGQLKAQDCNNNQILDSIDIQEGTSLDCNQDGVPDECIPQDLKLNAPIRFSTGERAFRLEVGDVDSDGNIDFISCSPQVGCDVFLGNGIGGFRSGEFIESGLNFAVRLNDINSDGHLDLLSTDDKGLVVKLGIGDGTFKDSMQFQAPQKSPEFGLEIGDFNNDQIFDAAVPGITSDNGEGKSIAVYLGNGDGSFQDPVITATAFRFGIIGSADIDKDGNLDVISNGQPRDGQRYGDAIAILFGNGDGTLGQPQTFPLTNSGFVGAVGLADFNDDGFIDVSCATTTGGDDPRVSIYINEGGGNIENTQSYDLAPEDNIFRNLTLADFDLDGNIDIALGGEESIHHSIGILYGKVDGTFSGAQYLATGNSFRLKAAKVNNDELPDLIATEEGKVLVVQNFGSRKFSEINTSLIPDFPQHISIGDIDDDQVQDLVVVHRDSSRISIHRGKLDGGFFEPSRFLVGGEPREIVLSNLNVDAFGDIAVIDPESDTIKIFYGDDDTHFEAGPVIDVDRSAFTLTSEDIDGDGNQDLLYVNRFEPRILLLFNRGEFGFEPQRQIDIPQDLAKDIEFADLDSDGIKDLIYAGNRGIMRFKGLGSGSFDSPQLINFPSNQLDLIEISDLNEDGRLDFVVGDTDADSTEVIVVYNEEEEFIHQIVYQDDRGTITGLLVDDFNSDGLPDIVLTQNQSQLTVILNQSEPNQFSTPIQLSAGAGIIGLGSSDFDLDGDPDLITVSRGNPSINWLLNEAPPAMDCDRNGLIDSCEIEDLPELDCNNNQVLDSCEIKSGNTADIDKNGLPDICQEDCDENNVPDSYEIQRNSRLDCNQNSILDRCEITENSDLDRDLDGILDSCQGGLQLPGDTNQDGELALADAILLLNILFLGEPKEFPCQGGARSESNMTLLDWQGDAEIDLSDVIMIMRHLYLEGPPHINANSRKRCIRISDCLSNLNCI